MRYTTLTTMKENNPRWLGSEAGYQSIHQFLVRNHGNPVKCSHCNKIGIKLKSGRWNIHWALKHGFKHGHFIDRYIGLCYSCHGIYDLTDKKRANLKRATEASNNISVVKQLERNKKRSLIAKDKPRDKYGHFIKKAT